jgi:hypothetical protein
LQSVASRWHEAYARVLKQLCRARSPKGEAILPNIYAATTGTPTANVDFYIGGQKRSASWTQGAAGDAMLSAVCVFDARTASIHVENTNDLAYTPLSLRILAGLAQACQEVKAKLAAEVKALERQTPAVLLRPECKPTTPVGKLIAGLSGKTRPEAVENLANLNAQEDARFQTLSADLASDPARTVRQLQGQESRIKKVIEQLEQLSAASTDETRTALRDAQMHLATARSAAAVASAGLFANEPLPEIGSDVWKVLWRPQGTILALPPIPTNYSPLPKAEPTASSASSRLARTPRSGSVASKHSCRTRVRAVSRKLQARMTRN